MWAERVEYVIMDKEYFKKYEPVYTPIAKVKKNKPSASENAVNAAVNRFINIFDDGDILIAAIILILFLEEDKDYITIIALALLLLS